MFRTYPPSVPKCTGERWKRDVLRTFISVTPLEMRVFFLQRKKGLIDTVPVDTEVKTNIFANEAVT